MITTEVMPTTVTSASERNAGCFAASSIPMPASMIMADIAMLFLYDESILRR